MADYRRESLATSHRARIALLEDQIEKNPSEKIRKMRDSEKATAERDYQNRIKDLDEAAQKADVIADPVAFGVLIVEGE